MVDSRTLTDDNLKQVNGGDRILKEGEQLNLVVGGFYYNDAMLVFGELVFKYLGSEGNQHQFLKIQNSDALATGNNQITTSNYQTSNLEYFHEIARPSWVPDKY